MKKIVGILLFIFWAAVAAILTAGFVFFQEKTNSGPPMASSPEESAGQMVLDSKEIGKHNSSDDCWMIIDNKVYDLTGYLGSHPGGAGSMIPYCGKDGSQAFAAKDQGKPHSSYANSLLVNYYIGNFNQEIDRPQNFLSGQLPVPSENISVSKALPMAPPVSKKANITLDAQEIAKHNSLNNCWLIVSGKVYNVTNYLGAHPGGAGAIAPYCGKEASNAFAGLPHSINAGNILKSYYIGNLNQSADAAQLEQNINLTNKSSPPVSGDSGEDEDDD